MTLGQRVAQKRKELGLSQEGLGEQLGVSRQAIYKWESDSSLPEIDKLITLSKIFSVSVGWLLGVEEEEPEPVNPNQERLVEDILSRYQAAQPLPQKSAWDKWSVRILFAMCGVMLALLVGTSTKMKELDRRYNDLANSMGEVTYTVNSQIGSITNRVESILKSQNNLMAEWSATLVSTDPETNTASFDLRAVPRTYVEGMTALFLARSGEETTELSVEAGPDAAFAGQITCPLADQIDLTVVLITGDKRETQWLDSFYDLYRQTFPDLSFFNSPLEFDVEDGVVASRTVRVRNEAVDKHLGWMPEAPASLQVGLFQDRKLIAWYVSETGTMTVDGTPMAELIWTLPQAVTLESGHEYCEAAVYTDEYGRQRIYSSQVLLYDGTESSSPISASAAAAAPYADGLTDWEF